MAEFDNLLPEGAQPAWMVPQSFTEAMQFAKVIADSDMVPKSHARKPGNVLVCMQIAVSFKIPLLPVLQNVAVINGRPAIWGDMQLALVRRHKDCVSVEEVFDDSTMTAVCTVVRRGEPTPIRRSFSQADAEHAGLWGKAGPWTQYPKRMIQMRARSFALRDAFPDALMGLLSGEEAEDIVDVETTEAQASPPAGVVARQRGAEGVAARMRRPGVTARVTTESAAEADPAPEPEASSDDAPTEEREEQPKPTAQPTDPYIRELAEWAKTNGISRADFLAWASRELEREIDSAHPLTSQEAAVLLEARETYFTNVPF